jgi:hypothetical protein
MISCHHQSEIRQIGLNFAGGAVKIVLNTKPISSQDLAISAADLASVLRHDSLVWMVFLR